MIPKHTLNRWVWVIGLRSALDKYDVKLKVEELLWHQ